MASSQSRFASRISCCNLTCFLCMTLANRYHCLKAVVSLCIALQPLSFITFCNTIGRRLISPSQVLWPLKRFADLIDWYKVSTNGPALFQLHWELRNPFNGYSVTGSYLFWLDSLKSLSLNSFTFSFTELLIYC